MTNLIEQCFTAFIDYATGDLCGRKSFNNLYDAKLFITETLFKWKNTGSEKTFPFGFTYEIVPSEGKSLNEQEINLPY